MIGRKDDTEFAIVSASMKYDGMYIDARLIYEIVKELGYQASFYQCVDVCQKNSFSEFGKIILGKPIKPPLLETAFNRYFTFPRAVRKLREENVLVMEQTLLNSVGGRKGVIVRIHDTLRLGKLQKSVPSTISAIIATSIWHRTIAKKIADAEKILVPSQFVRNEVIKLGGQPSSVHIVYDSLPRDRPDFKLNEPRKKSVGDTFKCLYVAADRPHKNLRFFIDMANAVNKLCPGRFEFHLVSKLNAKTEVFLSSRACRNLVVHSNVPNVASFYDNSDVLLFPSKYEGFGRPVVEAMSHGMPVIANDVGPLKEVMGAAGRLCGVDDMQQWIEKLIELTDESIYNSESILSLENSKRFLEDVVAKQLKAAIDA